VPNGDCDAGQAPRTSGARDATFEGEFSNVTRSYAGKGFVRHVWCISQSDRYLHAKIIRPAHDQAFEATDQPAEQGSNSMDDVLNLAQVKAELSYLNRLDQRRETNVESLKRLKEARDALLGRGNEVAGDSTSQEF
jgi:hypothetical protein